MLCREKFMQDLMRLFEEVMQAKDFGAAIKVLTLQLKADQLWGKNMMSSIAALDHLDNEVLSALVHEWEKSVDLNR